MHKDNQQQPERVDDDVPLTTRDLLATVKSTPFAALGRSHRLAVDDGRGRCGLPASCLANLFAKAIVDPFPRSIDSPVTKDTVHRILARKVLRKVSPLAASSIPVQDRIDDSPPID